ncbi:heparinase II/III domain-containing protein [Alteromonas ponticola]|uniref:Alginate lyase family protein n=1 Tax=Alteromonas ponticola TaxID=2720613 RepID=A0ABX1R3C5_9ALTE|nr:heparinase II/III family protein [Alteromonas ponticola]NMH60278.1 alginate lyase family protein [Alteromonas ponticola]
MLLRISSRTVYQPFALIFLLIWAVASFAAESKHPHLIVTNADIEQMRLALADKGRFHSAFEKEKQRIDRLIKESINVPVPKDGGGGYTHEQHKQNYQAMYTAGMFYQLTQQQKYAEYVRNMLLDYAELYPTLDVHPKRKVKSQNPGKLFWQSLNEAMWLVYTIQAYDLVHDALSAEERQKIEQQLLRPVAIFLSEGQPSTFDKIHNHGTWATAGVGMAGYVLDEPEWVKKALYGLDKSGKAGFIKQLDELFSPQGYYNEGPYYQRFALLPFVTFARAVDRNDPDLKIFQYRDSVLLKAIDTTIQLSYNGLFYPINDAIKSKGIETIELVHGVAAAYAITKDPIYLDIAQQQNRIVLTADGMQVANALDEGSAKPYPFKSVAFGDGRDGDQGALVVMRAEQNGEQALLFKPASQGLGHGHFDKLTWQFYDKGNEIVSDYGAARFLNVEAKFGGRYLPENESFAKQTIAHNTVVVDETSHFDGDVDKGNQHWPRLITFNNNQFGTLAAGSIDSAYPDTRLDRTLALVNLSELKRTIVIDIFTVNGNAPHQFDLPLYYSGQIIDTNFPYQANTTSMHAVGKKNGYQHLWLTASGTPDSGLAKVTWLNENGRFYTVSNLVDGRETFLFAQTGANDPDFNLRNEKTIIRRVADSPRHTFFAVLEPHGEYNPSEEYTLNADSDVSSIQYSKEGSLNLVEVEIAEHRYLIALDTAKTPTSDGFYYNGQSFAMQKGLTVHLLNRQQE